MARPGIQQPRDRTQTSADRRHATFVFVRGAALTVAIVVAIARAGVSGQQPTPSGGPGEAPRIPPFMGTLVNWDRAGQFTALCAHDDAADSTATGRSTARRTFVYVIEGEVIRQLGSTPGTCDPAFSPDGSRLAVVAANGVWTYTPRLDDPRQLADAERARGQAGAQVEVTLARPRWSADGRCLAYRVTNGRASWVEVIDVQTTRVLHRSAAGASEFAWTSEPRVIEIGGSRVRVP